MANNDNSYRVSRRHLLQQLAAAPLLLRPAALFGLPVPPTHAALPTDTPRYTPHYPVRSPLEDILRLVTPGLDDFPTEKYAHDIDQALKLWTGALATGNLQALQPTLAPNVQVCSLHPAHETTLRNTHGIRTVSRQFASGAQISQPYLLQQLREWIGTATVEHAAFELTSLNLLADTPLKVAANLRFNLIFQTSGHHRTQATGTWQTEWQAPTAATAPWQLTLFQPLTETRSILEGPGFLDITEAALGQTASFPAQLQHGADYWRTTLDGATGIDVYGNNGIAAGDFDNDGFDDLYVSQPAGLPNRLYRNRGDGTFEDVTDQAGVGVLDNTACALFADFRNLGLQDLLVVTGAGPLLFLNNGNGTFTLKPSAFRFAQPPQGTFTHAAIADYDRDGKLDIYFCLYSYYLGLDQYHYPTPYFDARNGPPNFLMHNQGDGTFTDRTAQSGLSADNDRYSFSCAWSDTPDSKYPDLYVVNDFGRNNLYRSNGNGAYTSAAEQAHVQDVGAGMSACWTDVDNDGNPDLYVADMWSAAGERVSHQPQFHTGSLHLGLYQRHARGNALYRNQGNGTFTNISDPAGVEVGRWAWGSDSWDFDHDGHQDLYVTNGYITAPTSANPIAGIDLGSFFWRQVVAKSPDDTTPSLAYEHGWNALNELIRTDSSWSGNERNVLFHNNGNGTFADIAGALNLDFLEDGRAFALADLDGDGKLEAIVKNRNAPQLRILRNGMQHLGDSIALRLRGTRSNRDSIGTVVVLTTGPLTQTRALQAGTGFLAQHTKELFFGLGNGTDAVNATVHWPSGTVQHFANLPRNSRIEIVENTPTFTAKPFAPTAAAYLAATAPNASPDTIPQQIGTWLLDPLPAPAFALSTLQGTTATLQSTRGTPTLLHLWSTANPAFAKHLRNLQQATSVSVLALNMDDDPSIARTAAAQLRLTFPILFATADVAGVYNLVFRYLFDRRSNLPLPTSFLLDKTGNIVKVYQGPPDPKELVADVRSIPTTPAERTRRALPFPGTLHLAAFGRNSFTYGVAMFQHGYLDQAAAAFEQVLAANPSDAEAHYNLGTLSLRRNDYPRAKQYLQRTLELKPIYPEAWNNLGMIAAQQGQTAEAVRSFQQSLSQRPTYATALLNLGNLYRHDHNFPQAEQYLSQALHLQPDDPESNYSFGMLYAQQNQFAEAQTYLQKAVTLRPDYPEALNNLGVLYVREQQDGKAEDLFQTCIRIAPNFEGTYLNLARLYLSQGNKSKARATLQQLLTRHPENPTAKQALAALDATP